MRSLSLLAALLCVFGIISVADVCHAQNSIPALGQGQRARGGQELAKLTADLKLTPSQVQQIKPILKSTRQQVMQVLNDANLTDAQKKSQVAEIRKAQRQQIRPILTHDQIAKWKTILAGRQAAL
jgi:Spy/CpxP family protein refolding chaperone